MASAFNAPPPVIEPSPSGLVRDALGHLARVLHVGSKQFESRAPYPWSAEGFKSDICWEEANFVRTFEGKQTNPDLRIKADPVI